MASWKKAMAGQLHRLDVDHSEHQLLDAVRRGGAFDVQMVRLQTGDYLIDDEVLIERKTIADFATSLADGRLFPQAARLAHSPHRSILLIEGPTPASVPAIHPHALEGALVSLAAMWRLPVLHSIDPEHSARILQLLANQASKPRQHTLRRFDRKPKRLASRRLFVLQGLPGVGPALAHRLLAQLGSVEGVITAGAAALTQVRGLGPKKAARIRQLVGW
jgi:DNA excision repair protein ERCC-4